MANLITIGRIVAVLVFIGVFTAEASWNMAAALFVFIVAALSDALDGWVARARNEVSRLGAALDPIADKLLITAALILLIRNGLIRGVDVYAALAIPLREILVSGLREALAATGVSLPVTRLAKFKTIAQSISIAMLIATAPTGVLSLEMAPFARFCLWVAAGLTVWTGITYVAQAARALQASESGEDA